VWDTSARGGAGVGGHEPSALSGELFASWPAEAAGMWMENLIRGRNPPQYQRSPCKEVRAALRKRPEEE